MSELIEPSNMDLGDTPDSVKEYLEGLQQRVGELEGENASGREAVEYLRKRVSSLESAIAPWQKISESKTKERDALAAHVERLTNAGNEMRKPWDLSSILGVETRRLVEQWDLVASQPPQTSLAERDAHILDEVVDLFAYPNDDNLMVVNAEDILQHANKIRNKDGE